MSDYWAGYQAGKAGEALSQFATSLFAEGWAAGRRDYTTRPAY